MDPASGYVRRNLSPAARSPIQLVDVVFPAGQRVAYESAAREVEIHQQVWMIDPALQPHQETEDVTVRRVGAHEAASCVEALAEVLIDCVEGGASVSFMLPLSRAKAVSLWRHVADGVARHKRVLLIAEDREGQIVGTVQSPHVHARQPAPPRRHREDAGPPEGPPARYRAAVMAAIDEAAREEGKTVLVLDTVTGSDAERLYERTCQRSFNNPHLWSSKSPHLSPAGRGGVRCTRRASTRSTVRAWRGAWSDWA